MLPSGAPPKPRAVRSSGTPLWVTKWFVLIDQATGADDALGEDEASVKAALAGGDDGKGPPGTFVEGEALDGRQRSGARVAAGHR